MPTVSIVLPTYNRIKYLPACIQSILNQTYVDFELLILDNGCTDTTPEYLQTLSDTRTKRFRVGSNGSVDHYQYLLNRVSVDSEYVCMFSDDDMMMPNNLEAKVGILQSTPYAFVASDVSIIDADSRIVKRDADMGWAGCEVSYNELKHWNRICMPSVVYRASYKHLWDGLRYGPLSDLAMWLSILKTDIEHAKGFKVGKDLVSYRIHAGSDSNRAGRAGFIGAYKQIFLNFQ